MVEIAIITMLIAILCVTAPFVWNVIRDAMDSGGASQRTTRRPSIDDFYLNRPSEQASPQNTLDDSKPTSPEEPKTNPEDDGKPRKRGMLDY